MKKSFNIILLSGLILSMMFFSNCEEDGEPNPTILLLGKWIATTDEASGCTDSGLNYVDNNPELTQEYFPDGTYILFYELTEISGNYLVTGNTILYQFPERSVDFEIIDNVLTTVWTNSSDGCTYTTSWNRDEE